MLLTLLDHIADKFQITSAKDVSTKKDDPSLDRLK